RLMKEYAGWRKFHREIKVTHPDGSVIAIDEEIADLLAAMWQAGISTLNSCQGHVDDLVYVVLADLADLERLLCSVSLGTLAVAVMNDDVGAPDSSPEEPWRWRYRLRPVNPNAQGPWRFIVSVEFPAHQVSEVIRCLEEYANGS
ncbi:MAG: hypothetical protein ACREJP_10365, partial [Candidatus Methylomirabilales bacterium]